MAVRLRPSDMDELDEWLKRNYATAYRTACLLLHDPVDAQDAVQGRSCAGGASATPFPKGRRARRGCTAWW